MKKLFLLMALVCNFMSVYAYRMEYGKNVVISSAVNEDLYIAGGTVTINAPVHGDLIIAGGTVIINDTVSNDLLVFGGRVNFNGFVGDDIRCVGGEMRISKNVAGDVAVTSGSVIIEKGIVIGGLLAGGGNITVDGNINGSINGAFGELIINGIIAGGMDCRGGKISINGSVGGKSVLAARNIVIGNNASFNNDVRYWNKSGSLDFKQAQKNGKTIYDPSLQVSTGEWYYLGAATLIGLLWYLGMALLMILIIQYLFAVTMKKAAETVFNNSFKSMGFGLLYFIGVPIAAVLAFITIIGVPVGLLLLMSYITLFLLATVITSLVSVNWYNNQYNKRWNYWRLSLTAFLFFIFFKVISSTPFVGWLIMFLLICSSFGGILLSIQWRRKQVALATQDF